MTRYRSPSPTLGHILSAALFLINLWGPEALHHHAHTKVASAGRERCGAAGLIAREGLDRPKVIDVILYNGESDLLNLRRKELQGAVDYHVVGITERTFRAEPNPVESLRASVTPDGRTAVLVVPWEPMNDACKHHGRITGMDPTVVRTAKEDKERHHRSACWQSFARNYLAVGVDAVLKGDGSDWVIVSDADEVPDRNMVSLLKECDAPVGGVLSFKSFAHYIYSTRCRVVGGRMYWYEGSRGPVAMTVDTMHAKGLQGPRNAGSNCFKEGPYASCEEEDKLILPAGAWHLSSCLMNEASMVRKMHSNVDRISDEVSVQGVHYDREQCNDPRGFYELKRLPQPAMHYPDVPHAVEEYPELFQGIGMS